MSVCNIIFANSVSKNKDISCVTSVVTCNDTDIPTWYHNLPTNVLVNIFKHFSEGEILRNILPVCQQWRYAALQPNLWKKIAFRGKQIPTKFICSKIRKFNLLDSIYLEAIEDPVAIIRQICRCNPYIQNLSLRHCIALPENVLVYLVNICKNLETLDFSGTEFQGDRFFEEIYTLGNLRSVNFSQNRFIKINHLLSLVLNCHNLEELRLSKYTSINDQLKDEDAAFLVSNVCDHLKILTIDASNLSHDAYQSILNCYKLKKLGIYSAVNLSGEVFVDLWKNFPCLTELKIIQANQIGGDHVEKLFTSGKHVFNKIIHLNFTGCWKITDNGIKAIANCCKDLEVIILKSCKSIKSISSLCESCIKLKTINIAFCVNLNTDSLLPIKKNFRKLFIDRNQINSFLINELKYSNVHVYLHLSEYNKKMVKLQNVDL